MDIFNDKLLILSPHADDEILGCGGLIAKHRKESVYIAEFTMGSLERRKEFERFLNDFNIKNHNILYEDKYHLHLDTVPMFEIINKIDEIIQKFNPEVVAIPFPSFNQDHKIVYQCSTAVLRSRRTNVRTQPFVIIYEYPQINWIIDDKTFMPNCYIDISSVIEEKVEMLKYFSSQINDAKYAISINGMVNTARYRGNEISVEAAEAYMIKRLIF
ncbi:MAG: PIG-L family deacetylase [Oscillospiraceae bacterium]|jgi:LmbE family N-acetylglucosaminyl deacetylase|nr:PIG-L family deacetylase [Oscillospiraceae bacterium]